MKLNKGLCIYLLITYTVLIFSCSKQDIVNIYDSKEYKILTQEDLKSGESTWSIACFRCHEYGTNGAIILDDKRYWDSTASKGIDDLFKSVWKGKQGENGMMPAKGFCNLCSEDDIRKSVLYIFYLARKVQAENDTKSSS